MAQLLKNLLVMWETWVQSLDWEDLLEKGTATHSGLENSTDCIVHGVAKELDMTKGLSFIQVRGNAHHINDKWII